MEWTGIEDQELFLELFQDADRTYCAAVTKKMAKTQDKTKLGGK